MGITREANNSRRISHLFVLCSIFARDEFFAAQAAANWQADWDAMQRAAEKESRLVIYGPTGADQQKLYSKIFQQAFPKIKVNYTPGRISEMSHLDFRRRTARRRTHSSEALWRIRPKLCGGPDRSIRE